MSNTEPRASKGRRLLVPVAVGRSKTTFAFVPLGTHVTNGNESRIVNHATHFLKVRPNPRVQEIRDHLQRAGIPFETPIESYEKHELFAGSKFRPLWNRSRHGPAHNNITNPRAVARQITKIIIDIHRLGVSHLHLHANNFVVDKSQRVKLIDSKFLFMHEKQPSTRDHFMSRYAMDILYGAQVIVSVLHPTLTIVDKQFTVETNRTMQKLIAAHASFTNTYGVTPEEIRDFRPTLQD